MMRYIMGFIFLFYFLPTISMHEEVVNTLNICDRIEVVKKILHNKIKLMSAFEQAEFYMNPQVYDAINRIIEKIKKIKIIF